MNVMTKRGQIDNVITYEHVCDTLADMPNIPANEITLGSICIVLEGATGALDVLMAKSNKQWISLITSLNNNDSNESS